MSPNSNILPTSGVFNQEADSIYTMLMHAPIAMAVMNGPAFTFEMVNEKALTLWGKKHEAIINQPLFTTFPELPAQGFAEILNNVLETGEPFTANERQITLTINGNTEYLYINFTYHPVRNQQGLVDRILLFMVDVSEQVIARHKVEDSARELSSLAAAMPQLVWVANPSGKVVYYNDRIAEFAGVVKHANNQWQWDGMLHQDDLLPTWEAWETSLRTEQAYDFTHRVLMKNGTYRWHLSRAVPHRNNDGRVNCWYGTSTDIHTQKEAEQKLEFLAALSRNVADAIVGVDTNMHITSWNKGAEMMYGWSSADVVGQPITDVLKTTYMGEDDELLAYQTLLKQGYWKGEVMQKNRYGELIPVLASIAFVYNSAGQNLGAVGVNRDISPQKKIEQALIDNKEQLEITFQNAPTAIFHFNGVGKIMYMNKKSVEIMGEDDLKDVLESQDVFEFRQMIERRFLVQDEHGKPLPPENSSVYKALTSLQYAEVVTHLIHHTTSKEHWFLAGSQPLLDSNGKLMLILTTWTDITLQKKSEKAIRQSEKNFRQLANLIPQIVFTATPTGLLNYVNQQWYNYTGGNGEQALNNWATILHPDDLGEHLAKWKESITTGVPYLIEYRIYDVSSGSYRWFLGKAVPVRNENGQVTKWFGTCTDIDDQKQFAARLESVVVQRTLELKRSNDELMQFAHVASHDLKEPARKVRTFGTRLLMEFGQVLPEKVVLYINKMVDAAKRMSTMIEGVLKYASIAPASDMMLRIDLNEVVSRIENDLELMMMQRSASIIYSNLPAVHGAPELIQQLFYNIIYNSLKFAIQNQPAVITIGANPAASGFVMITIADNGIGFKPEQANKIFDTFTRLNAKDQFEGSGIGLALCKRIIERHGGEISATAIPMGGATFIFTLPLANMQHQ